MDRSMLLRASRSAEAPALELWLVLCALVGLACWWLSHRAVGTAAWSADLAIGHGLPLLADELGSLRGLTLLRDVDDPTLLVADGTAPVAVDADPDGVRIVYRADARGVAPVLVELLRERWPDAQVQTTVDFGHPDRLLPLLAATLSLNLGALVVWWRLRRLGADVWWRWLSLQGVTSPDLLLALLGRPAVEVALLAGVALFTGLGPDAVVVLSLPMMLLALAGVGLGLLAAAVPWARVLLLWTLAQGALFAVAAAPFADEQVLAAERWTLAAWTVLGIVLLCCLAMRHRLAYWIRGQQP